MEIHNIRGYLYEIFIGKHLKDNGFDECLKGKTTRGCKVNTQGEIEGRGEYHQIDFAGVYTKLTPYIYPLRVLAECKYYKTSLQKHIIRQYIGVIKDISENYYVPSETKSSNKKSIFDKQIPRFTDVPIIFSVNGFDTHSENLAWAQGINLVSHRGIPIFDEIIGLIDLIAQEIKDFCTYNRCKESDCIKLIKFAINKIDISNVTDLHNYENVLQNLLVNQNFEDLNDIFHHCFHRFCCSNVYEFAKKLKNINTFIIATTEKGTVLILVSGENFPIEYFQINSEQLNNTEYNPNRAQVGVYFESLDNDNNNRVFYFQFNRNGNEDSRKFYFQPSRQMLSDQFPELSEQKRIDLKKDFMGILSFIYDIDKVTRVLELEVKFPYETREELNKMLNITGENNE